MCSQSPACSRSTPTRLCSKLCTRVSPGRGCALGDSRLPLKPRQAYVRAKRQRKARKVHARSKEKFVSRPLAEYTEKMMHHVMSNGLPRSSALGGARLPHKVREARVRARKGRKVSKKVRARPKEKLRSKRNRINIQACAAKRPTCRGVHR